MQAQVNGVVCTFQCHLQENRGKHGDIDIAHIDTGILTNCSMQLETTSSLQEPALLVTRGVTVKLAAQH
jgi:hypothetical protein